MKEYTEIEEFALQHKIEEIKDFFRENPNPLHEVIALAIHLDDNNILRDYALDNMDDYVTGIQSLIVGAAENKLLFPSLVLAENLYPDYIDNMESVLARLNLSGAEKLDFFLKCNRVDVLTGEFDVEEDKIVLTPNPLNYLIEGEITVRKDDDFELLSSVSESFPVEVRSVGDDLVAEIPNQRKVETIHQKETLLSQLRTLVKKGLGSPVGKYAGIAISIGLVFAGDAEAASNDAVQYIEILDSHLASLADGAPEGCRFGAEIIDSNKTGVHYKIHLGDYVSNNTIYGNREAMGAKEVIGRLKDMKGCGLDGAESRELFKDIALRVKDVFLK